MAAVAALTTVLNYEVNGNSDMNHKHGSRPLLSCITCILVLLVIYVGAYLACVTPHESVAMQNWFATGNAGVIVPRYRFFQEKLRWVFWPAAQLDPRERILVGPFLILDWLRDHAAISCRFWHDEDKGDKEGEADILQIRRCSLT